MLTLACLAMERQLWSSRWGMPSACGCSGALMSRCCTPGVPRVSSVPCSIATWQQGIIHSLPAFQCADQVREGMLSEHSPSLVPLIDAESSELSGAIMT